jgi:antitoxin FitA
MAQILIQRLDKQLMRQLESRARRSGCSMEEEARDILRNALGGEDSPAGGLGSEIASLFRDHGLDAEIPELRGHVIISEKQVTRS